MKIITNKSTNGLTPKEFTDNLLVPVPKTQFTAKEIDELRETIESAIAEYGGLGLSANQLGIRKRACIINVGDEPLFLVNPVIVDRDKEGFLFYEGCLSMPKTMEAPIRTIRSIKVTVMTDNLGELVFEINPEGDKEQVSDETLRTVVVQHEIDHLDGITIKDRFYSTTVKKRKDYGRNDKILMKSPDNQFVEVKYKKANEYFVKGYEIV
ncbi:Def N-formylmethionyl-tRNA deformylase [uncultured Caudovirales phage]|uniref:Def N-formylmethionyl-tRNA deformylase n=1 Tax=uncultured Caudovirales phage TaxID=2100421 RepID=A0A6J5MA12_9CAUD|nr:Def N-formylmethionyl-tRNA deformylase [uncultured Caudovirales phage]